MIGDRLRKSRQNLSLTQEYVAQVLGLTRTAIVQMENDKRKVSDSELKKLCLLYGVSADYILDTNPSMESVEMFARGFDRLCEEDKREILNLMEFKRQLSLKQGKI